MNRLSILIIASALTPLLYFASERKVISATVKPPFVEQKIANTATAFKAAPGELIDINSAPEKQLKAIAGVGSEYSERIIAGRPYSTQEQLVTRRIIPKDLYEKIKEQIIAKQAF